MVFLFIISEVNVGKIRLDWFWNTGSADGTLILDLCSKIDALLMKTVHALQCFDADFSQRLHAYGTLECRRGFNVLSPLKVTIVVIHSDVHSDGHFQGVEVLRC